MEDGQSTMSAMSNGTAKQIGDAHLNDLPRAPLLPSRTVSVASLMTGDRRRNRPVANRALGPLGLRVVGGTPNTALFTDRNMLWDTPAQRAQRPHTAPRSHAVPAVPVLVPKLPPAYGENAADDASVVTGATGATVATGKSFVTGASAVTGATGATVATGKSFVSPSSRLPREPLLHLTHNKVPHGADYARAYCLACTFEEVTARALDVEFVPSLISMALSAAHELARPHSIAQRGQTARLGRIPSSRRRVDSTRYPPPPWANDAPPRHRRRRRCKSAASASRRS